jgi:hypothetical protein
MAAGSITRRVTLFADGEAVWSRRPDAGVKPAAMLAHRGLRWWQESPVTKESAE